MLSARSFCTFLREFSPLEMYAGEIKIAPLSPSRNLASGWSLVQRFEAAIGLIWAAPWLALRLLPMRLAQLAINSSPSQVGHVVARFAFSRDWRASFLAASSLSGIGLPVPKYISSGVWPRNAEWGRRVLCSST